MKDKLKGIGKGIIEFFTIIFKGLCVATVFCIVDVVWGIIDFILCKIEKWLKSTKIRHWIYAFITLVLSLKGFEEYGILSQNTFYIILYLSWTWCAVYLIKFLIENQSVKGSIARSIAVLIFIVTFVSSLLVVPLIFDMIYFKGLLYIDNGSMVTILMFLFIFTSPTLLIVGVRGLGVTITNNYNYRKYILIVLTVITVLKVTNDFESIYTLSYSSYLCEEEEQDEYCNDQSDPYVTFETDTTLWMMNQVIYQSMVIIFLLDNITSKKEYLDSEVRSDIDLDISS